MSLDHGGVSDLPVSFALPAVRLPPVGELASAARNCDRVHVLRRLAEWADDRRTTKTGNLTLADARAAVQELGLPDDQGPGRTAARSAAGFPELQDLWELVVELDLVELDGGRAEIGGTLEMLRYDQDHDVLDFWTDLLAVTLEPALPSQGDPTGLVPMLIRLYIDSSPVDSLAVEVAAVASDLDVESVRSSPRSRMLVTACESVIRGLLAELELIDAVVLDGDQATLTDLCRYGLSTWFEEGGLQAPIVTDLAQATVTDLLDLGSAISGRGAVEALFREWVTAWGPGPAIDAIVEHARGGTPQHRVAAFGLLDRLDNLAQPAVRSCLDDRDLRPHAVGWLMGRELFGDEPRLDDLQRLYLDVVAADLTDDDEFLRDSIVQLAGHDADQVELIDSLWLCDHAQVVEVLDALARHHPHEAAARAARKAALRARSAAAERPAAQRRTAK